MIKSSEKKDDKEEKNGEKVTCRKFNYASFQRSFQLPEKVKSDDINSEYKGGLLFITLPKLLLSKTQKPKKIEVK